MIKRAIGVDVAKHELVIYLDQNHYSIKNDKKELNNWFKSNKDQIKSCDVIAYEPTGGYERTLTSFLKDKSLPGFRAHANHVRYYAKAMSLNAKTDNIDAKIIAEFAISKCNAPDNIANHDEDLTALISRRQQLIDMKKQENSRLDTINNKIMIKDIKSSIKTLEAKIKKFNTHIQNHIKSNPKSKEDVELMESIAGVGFITASSILGYLPEIFVANNKSLAALSGLAPMNKDSGNYRGKRRIFGGRSQVRNILYMATITAKTYNPVIKDFFDRLIKKGKPFKTAMTAAMRKLLTIIRSVVTRRTPWVNEAPINI